MKRKRTKHLEFIIGDIAALELAVLIAFYLPAGGENTLLSGYIQVGFLTAVLMLCISFFKDGYNNILRRGYLVETMSVCRLMLAVWAIELLYLFLIKSPVIYIRTILVSIWIMSTVLICAERLVLKKLLRWKFSKMDYASNVLVIACEEQADTIMNKLSASQFSSFYVTAMCIVGGESGHAVKYGGRIAEVSEKDLMEYVTVNVIDEIVISIPSDPRKEEVLTKRFLNIGIVVHIYMEQHVAAFANTQVEYINGINVLTCYNRELSRAGLFCKRIFDILGGLAGLLAAVLIGIAIAPFIYRASPGPLIFSQIRVGKNGRKFRIYKFRSMYMDAEQRKQELAEKNEMNQYMFKMKDDPRVIKGIGLFIRERSLDEFPQFFNVLKGDMSLVGTRPPTVDEYEKYEFDHKKRLCMKPGITGLWQISGRNDISDFDEIVELDWKYIDNWSMGLDLKILAKTVITVLSGKGAR